MSAFGHSLAYYLLLITFGPISGGHFNPLITASTLGTGKSTMPRAVLYILLQCFGGFLAALTYIAMYGNSFRYRNPECGYLDEERGAGEYILFEILQNTLFLFFVYAIGFDSRVSSLLGPFKAPLLLALAYGLMLFSNVSNAYASIQDDYSDDGESYGYRWGSNFAFCIGSKFYDDYYFDNDAQQDNFVNGTGYTFCSIIISVIIHSLLYLVLAPASPQLEDEEEEKGRNKQRLLVEMA